MNVRSAGKRLLERLGMRQGFRPDWRPEGLLETLSSRSAPVAALRQARSSLPPLELVGRAFRERRGPRFFVDSTDIPRLVLRIESEHPSWKAATVRRAREDCQEGLGIYVRRGPVLNGRFPWGGVERGPGGDKLYRKRPHRFAFAPRLALAALYGEPTDAVLHETLLGWMAFASGTDNALAYDSNLAVIQRVLALSSAFSFLAARENPGAQALALEGLVLQVIHEDARFLAPRLGHSYPNNHLLADGFGGWFLGLLWPELCGSGDLRTRFEPLWLRELGRQTLADGSNFEHTAHYHEYACEMASAYAILCRRNGVDLPEWAPERIRRLLEFQAALSASGSDTIRFGDAAEDPLFPLDSGDGWATAAWPDLLNGLFSAGVQPADGGASRERAFWMLGGNLSKRAASAASATGIESFALGGYYVFRDGTPGTSLTFRTGPDSREACSPGHAHADFLSVYLTSAGRPFLVDAGTYTYRRISERWPRGEPDWRGYFSGPSAHNGLAIDGQDPLGAFEGDFRKELRAVVSTRKAASDPHTSWVDAIFGGEGEYAGYQRGVIHVRGEYWIVYDVLPPAPGKARSLGFQFGAECRVARLEARDVEVRREDESLFVSASAGLAAPHALIGSRDPVGGWVSRVYGELAPAPQVRFPVAEGTTVSAFLLRLVSPEAAAKAPAAIEVERLEPAGLRLDVEVGAVTDTLLVSFVSPEIERHSRGTRFRGDLARIRRRSGRLDLVHWLNGRSLLSPQIGLGVESPETLQSLALDSRSQALESTGARGLSIRWPGPEV